MIDARVRYGLHSRRHLGWQALLRMGRARCYRRGPSHCRVHSSRISGREPVECPALTRARILPTRVKSVLAQLRVLLEEGNACPELSRAGVYQSLEGVHRECQFAGC
jgi:hypothetical protein